MKQEKKLQEIIICGGASYPAFDELDNYLDDSKSIYTIGVDAGCLKLIAHGYQIDFAVGDFDSVTEEEFQSIKKNSKTLIQHPAQKDDTDMELAMEIAFEHYPQASYYILGAIGEKNGRLDHMLANIWMVYQPRYKAMINQMYFIECNHVFQFLTAGTHQLNINPESQLPDYLSVISMTPVKALSIEGALYELPPTDFDYPRALISNEFINDKSSIQISFKEGLVLVLWVNERN
ncbi:thiamine diphosphokinase [Aerococcaceae bacterium WGS1372]